MTNHVQEAFRRAAMRGAPLWRRFDVFGFPRERPAPGELPRLRHWFSAPGALRWQDTDEPGNEIREEVPYNAGQVDGSGRRIAPVNTAGRVIAYERGLILATLFTDWTFDQTPDYLRDESGFFYRVRTLLGMDMLNAGVRLECRRRFGDPPLTATDAP